MCDGTFKEKTELNIRLFYSARSFKTVENRKLNNIPRYKKSVILLKEWLIAHMYIYIFVCLIVIVLFPPSIQSQITTLVIFSFPFQNLDINELHGLNFHCSRNSTTW